MHLSQQYSTGKSNITVTDLEQTMSTGRGGKQTAPPMPERFHAVRQCRFYFFLPFFSFKRTKTNLNKNCEHSHAFDTYMPHFYSSNRRKIKMWHNINIRERVFFSATERFHSPSPQDPDYQQRS